MFQELSDKLDSVIRQIKGQGKITEKNITRSLREIRRVLLEADVNYKVAKSFITSVQQKSLGTEVVRSITPGQQIVKIIHDELTELMGRSDAPINFDGSIPNIIMLTGLQGSGKTTLAGKLALHLKEKAKNPVLVAADLRRPAAVRQLEVVGKAVDVPVIADLSKTPVEVCQSAIPYCKKNGYDVAIFDTAGRLHVDDELMQELQQIKDKTKPREILFVADGMTGQDAVNTASEFLQRIDFDGIVLTKMDGDARG
ncbi:signal recognition particle protein, partial [candidate division KSB1 bacterium]|nr:signal recognition particle protein [candidate division KSB1 bacterium]